MKTYTVHTNPDAIIGTDNLIEYIRRRQDPEFQKEWGSKKFDDEESALKYAMWAELKGAHTHITVYDSEDQYKSLRERIERILGRTDNE